VCLISWTLNPGSGTVGPTGSCPIEAYRKNLIGPWMDPLTRLNRFEARTEWPLAIVAVFFSGRLLGAGVGPSVRAVEGRD
jgi:hypothetical protein